MGSKNVPGRANAVIQAANNQAYDLNQQAAADDLARNQPFIDAGVSAFGLKGTLNLDDKQFQQNYQNQQSQNYNSAINAGMANAGNLTPLQQESLRKQLGLGLQQYGGDYNAQYNQEMGNRRQQYQDYNNNVAQMGNIGLGAIGTGMGIGNQLAGQWANTAMENRDSLLQSQLLAQQAADKEKSTLYGLYGQGLSSIANIYAANRSPSNPLDSTSIQTASPDWLG